MKLLLSFIFCVACGSLIAQSGGQLVLKGNFTSHDSVQVVMAFHNAKEAVDLMHQAMQIIWATDDNTSRSNIKTERASKWNDQRFGTWLGEPNRIGKVKRRIDKIKNRFDRKVTLNVTKENKGKCSGWISAWAIPFGKVKITLCEDYFIYRTHLQEKILIHEIGHETGILFHHKIHGCRAARRAAKSGQGNVAKKSTENYAWLAMSFLELECAN